MKQSRPIPLSDIEPTDTVATYEDLHGHLDADIDRLVLAVIRFTMCGQETAALQACVAVLGAVDGPALFNRATALSQAIRRERIGMFHLLPAPCERMTADERDLIDLWRLARQGDHRRLIDAVRTFTGRDDGNRVIVTLIETVTCADAVCTVSPHRVLH
jgi:hypothetical protein